MKGAYDQLRLAKFENIIDKVIKLQKKYGNNDKVIRLNHQLKLEKRLGKVILFINEQPLLETKSNFVTKLSSSVKSGMTLGIAKGSIYLSTTDKTINNAYLKEVYQKLVSELESYESRLKMESNKKWSL